MSEPDDHQLLAEFARTSSEAAFAALVQRHVNLVYSTARRSVGNAHAAEEIAQAVFIILTQKAGRLSSRIVLSGWLYQTTRLTAANFLRGEIRRQQREQESYMQSTLNQPGENVWPQIAPLLDDALGKLGERDRNAIVLRFLENKSLAEVGAALSASEDAAKMRVNRALEKLRKLFTKRGVALSATLIAGAVSSSSVQAAPVGLAKTISAVAITKGAAAGVSTLALVKGALKIMAWTKAKMAVVVGVGVLLAAGTATITVKEIQEHRTYPWQVEGFNSNVLDQQPPQVRVLLSKYKNGASGTSWDKTGQIKVMGTGVSAEAVVHAAYRFYNPSRTVFSAELPQSKFDYIGSLAAGNEKALQQLVKKKFGVIAKRETRETEVFILKIRRSGAGGLKPSSVSPQAESSSQNNAPGEWSCKNSPLSGLVHYLEECTRVPILDQTGLKNNFDIDLKWKQSDWEHQNSDGMKQSLLDQLGLELVPSREPVEMLVVEKVK